MDPPHFDPSVWEDDGNANVWENAKSRMLIHLSQFAQVDTYVCVNEAAGLSADGGGEVTQIFEFTANGQLDRAAQCVSKVKQTGQEYDWFIKTRPDFFALQYWPDVTKFNPDYVYTRFRAVAGLKGLTSHALSWYYCQHDNCGQSGLHGHGYVNDDMLVVASRKLIDHVFAPQQPAHFLPAVHFPDFDIPAKEFYAEAKFTTQMIANHILTMPLFLAGCPLASGFDHCPASYDCRNSPMPVTCGTDSIAFPELHNRMRPAE